MCSSSPSRIAARRSRNIVLHRFAMRDRLLQHGARGALLLEVALERFESVFAEEELAEVLEVRQPFEEENPLDEAIGVLHLVERLLLLVVFQLLQAPVADHAGM